MNIPKWVKSIVFRLLTLILCLGLVSVFAGSAAASAEKLDIKGQKNDKKVIVFFLDAISWDDLRVAELPTLRRFIDGGEIGLMNTKTRGMNRVNKESGYFTFGVGIRANAPDGSGQQVTADPKGFIKVRQFDAVKELLKHDLPNYQAGQFGATAKELGLKVALVGNADTEVQHREAALAVMDETGIVPFGSIGEEMLVEDKDFPGRYRTNEKVLFEKTKAYLREVDVLFIDFGDTARINEYAESIDDIFGERQKALKKADGFLQRLDGIVDWDNTLLLIVVPNASQTSIENGNTSLTPFIKFSGHSKQGFVISNTTRREALVANIDLAPTIIQYLTGDKGNFVGEPISFLEMDSRNNLSNLEAIEKKERKLFNLRWGRFITHGFYVTLIILSLAFNFIPPLARKFRVSEDLKFKLAAITLVYPLTIYVIGPLLPYRHFILETILILLFAVVLSLTLLNLLQRRYQYIVAVSLATFIVLLLYLFFAPSFLLNSPLGFDDVFLGGRYFGMNNDSMGIMLGSALMGFFGLAQWTGFSKLVKKFMIIIPLILTIIALTPVFGANVGGTISAMSVTVLAFLYLFTGGQLTWRKVLIVVGLVFVAEVFIAYLDSLFEPPNTHAGKAMKALLNSGFMVKFPELLVSKLRLFGMMAVIPPYNLILLGEVLIFSFILRGKDNRKKIFEDSYPEVYGTLRIFFFGGLIAFFFNDTGVIATAMMYTYFLLPYSILAHQKA